MKSGFYRTAIFVLFLLGALTSDLFAALKPRLQINPIVIEDIVVAGGGANASCSWSPADKILEEEVTAKGIFVPFDPGFDASKYFIRMISKNLGSEDCFRMQYDNTNSLFVDPRGSTMKFLGDACSFSKALTKDTKKFDLKVQTVSGGVMIYNLQPSTSIRLEVKRSKYICTLSDTWNPNISVVPYPNPTSGYVYLKFNAPLSLTANIRIIDDTGNLIYDARNLVIDSGPNAILIDLNTAKKGLLNAQIQFCQKNGPPTYRYCLIEKL